MDGEEKVESAGAANGDVTATEKKPLKFDFDSILAADVDLPPDELVIIPVNSRRQRPKRKKISSESSSESSVTSAGGADLSRISDAELTSKIERCLGNIKSFGATLPDKGDKLRSSLRFLEDELERRKLRRANQDDVVYKKPMDSGISSINGVLERSKQEAPSSEASGQSEFGALLMKKLDCGKTDSEPNTGDEASNAFDCQISSLNSHEKRRRKQAGKLPPSRYPKRSLCSKEFYPWNPRNGQKCMSLNDPSGKASMGSLPLTNEKLARPAANKDASQPMDSDESKKEKTVVLVDEEEFEDVHQKQEAELPSSISEGKIYYPSREAPESLEIFYSELNCLEPGECLTSTIMNFYIRYLQELQSPTDSSQHYFYFFNTYFYSKLQKAVEYKKSDKEAFFIKFRRWWRGVNIFQKAYIFLPINDDNHWSLVIVCNPDEEDDSGLIILHLDSLGMHYRASIVHNIKSLLINEWNYLKEENGALDIPIPERIWKHLPRRIEDRTITVPRQTNDYDCGLFVLYYMERFIKEAQGRLKRKDLSSMFGRNWFKPQEASGLRGKIKHILRKAFHEATEEENHSFQPVSLSPNAKTDKSRDVAKIS